MSNPIPQKKDKTQPQGIPSHFVAQPGAGLTPQEIAADVETRSKGFKQDLDALIVKWKISLQPVINLVDVEIIKQDAKPADKSTEGEPKPTAQGTAEEAKSEAEVKDNGKTA